MPVGIGTLPMWLQDVGSARTGRTPSDILKNFPSLRLKVPLQSYLKVVRENE